MSRSVSGRADQGVKVVSVAELKGRKRAHLELCAGEDVEFGAKTTLLEEVDLVHNALPEIRLQDIDLSLEFLGRRLGAPLAITGMTGGTEDGFAVNRDLATVAQHCGLAIGLGSQRVMQRDPSTAWTFRIREFAPTALIFANIGVTQASDVTTATLRDLIRDCGADALCVHLNPAQELIQADGDRDFRGGYATLARLVDSLDVPIIAKETGCGISHEVGDALRRIGVRIVDVSGAGGTSWIKVETLRGDARGQALGAQLASWGIPTAAALASLRDSGLQIIASGGLRTGLDMAKAIALGARLCGAALPVYRAYREGGIEGATAYVESLLDGLRGAMLLTGSPTLERLRRQRVVLGPRVQAWVEATTPGPEQQG